MAAMSPAAGASPASGRYFDVYTERASPVLDDGLPRSTSQLKIVSKGRRGNKRITTTSPTRTKTVACLSPSAVEPLDDTARQSIDPSPPAPSPQGYHPPPRSSSKRTVHTIEALRTGASPSSPGSSSPLLEAGRQTTHSRPERRAPRASRDDTRLAVLPVDLYAGPTTPVSADSLTALGVSESPLEPSDNSLEHKAAAGCGDTTSTSSRLRASSSGSGSMQRRHDRLASGKGGVPRSRSSPSDTDLDGSGQGTLSRSSTASAMPPHPQTSLPRSTTVSSVASTFSHASFGSPTDELELSWNVSLDGPGDQAAIQSIDDIIRSHRAAVGVGSPSLGLPPGSPPVPAIPDRFRVEPVAIPSIDDIIRKNSAALNVPLPRPLGRAASSPAAAAPPGRSRARTTTEETTTSSQARSSIDSISGEVLRSLQVAAAHVNKPLHHARSQPSMSAPASGPAPAARSRQQPRRKRQSSQGSDMSSAPSASTSASPRFGNSSRTSLPTTEDDIAQYLRSPRLTRLLTLRRAPNHHLHVSLADVGCPTGHPVVIFLGLGSVRYLVALYDELAVALGLRLICIDRWGLGKTGSVPDARRGFLEWAAVVQEVLDQLDITRFSILAHSAGAPYALASTIRLDARVHGSVHLLAPWVSTAAEAAAGAYRWLRYVPSGVIRTAQAAEWKMQSWKLGKPPPVPMLGVGFDPRAPLSSDSAAASPVFAQFFEQPDINRSRSADDGSSGSEASSDPLPPNPYPRAMTASPAVSTRSSQESNARRRPNMSSPALLPVPPHRHSNGPPGKRSSKGLLGGLFGSPKPGNGELPAGSRSTSPSIRSSSPVPSALAGNAHRSPGVDLGTALLRASHAESLQGGTADLLTILERTNKAVGFSYGDVERPVKVWHGLKDDKISLNSVLGLESSMQSCKVTVIPGADHSLMTNVPVVVQVLNSIASEWRNQVI